MSTTNTDVDEPYDEKRISSTLCDGSDNEERVARTRELLVKEFPDVTAGEGEFSDLDMAIKTIEALLTTNEDIFDRCKRLFLPLPSYTAFQESQTFAKHKFDVVKVWSHGPPTATQMVVFMERELKVFNLSLLFNLPTGLDIFQPEREKHGFIDYRRLLRTSLMLHDDIILSYLDNLKVHLEKIQVCLGEIDAWLMDTFSNINYLENTFDTELDPKGTNMPKSDWCRCGDHVNSDLCGLCGQTYQKHKTGRGTTLRYCPEGFEVGSDTFCCDKLYQQLGNYSIQGKYEATFDISKESDREQLKMFSEFLSKQHTLAQAQNSFNWSEW